MIRARLRSKTGNLSLTLLAGFVSLYAFAGITKAVSFSAVTRNRLAAREAATLKVTEQMEVLLNKSFDDEALDLGLHTLAGSDISWRVEQDIAEPRLKKIIISSPYKMEGEGRETLVTLNLLGYRFSDF